MAHSQKLWVDFKQLQDFAVDMPDPDRANNDPSSYVRGYVVDMEDSDRFVVELFQNGRSHYIVHRTDLREAVHGEDAYDHPRKSSELKRVEVLTRSSPRDLLRWYPGQIIWSGPDTDYIWTLIDVGSKKELVVVDSFNWRPSAEENFPVWDESFAKATIKLPEGRIRDLCMENRPAGATISRAAMCEIYSRIQGIQGIIFVSLEYDLLTLLYVPSEIEFLFRLRMRKPANPTKNDLDNDD